MTGDYLSWLSHDDVYLPAKVESQVSRLGSVPSGAVLFGDYVFIDAGGRLLGERRFHGRTDAMRVESSRVTRFTAVRRSYRASLSRLSAHSTSHCARARTTTCGTGWRDGFPCARSRGPRPLAAPRRAGNEDDPDPSRGSSPAARPLRGRALRRGTPSRVPGDTHDGLRAHGAELKLRGLDAPSMPHSPGVAPRAWEGVVDRVKFSAAAAACHMLTRKAKPGYWLTRLRARGSTEGRSATLSRTVLLFLDASPVLGGRPGSSWRILASLDPERAEPSSCAGETPPWTRRSWTPVTRPPQWTSLC